MSPIRILTFSQSFSGKEFPGLQAKIFSEFLALSEKFKLMIITEQSSVKQYENINIINVFHVSIPIIQTIYRIISHSYATLKLRKNFDIAYTRYLAVHFLVAGLISKLFLNKKLVVQLSGPRINAKGFRGRFFRPFLRKALNVADIIISNSEFVVSNIENYLGEIDRQKIMIFNEGIDLQQFQPIKNPKIKNVILTVSRISPVKGIEAIVESIPYVKQEIPDLLLNIVGPIDDKSYYKKLKFKIAQLECEKFVNFVGPISNEKVKDYYNSSKIFLLTSKSEGSSISTLEAMACGMPVIVTSVGGLPSLIKDGFNGYLIKNNEPQILAQKISLLLKNEDISKKIGKNARKTVEENFSVDFFISNLSKVFQDLV